MHATLPAVTLLLAVGVAFVPGCAPRVEPPPRAKAMAVQEVDTSEAEELAGRYLEAARAGKCDALASCVSTAAIAAARVLKGAEAVELLSISCDETGTPRGDGMLVLVAECDVTYSDESLLRESGIHIFRVTLKDAEDGWRIVDFGP